MVPGVQMPGWALADNHVNRRKLADAFNAMVHRRFDRSALRQLRLELAELDGHPNPRARGLKFQSFVQGLLAAHGCDVEIGKHIRGEQVDVMVHRPFRALLECRWAKDPVGVEAVSLLISKLTRDRPAIVAGLYVSMKGFTSPARTEARTHARERVVILLDRVDVETLLSGKVHVADLFDQRVDALVSCARDSLKI
jgi:hypothetical protein